MKPAYRFIATITVLLFLVIISTSQFVQAKPNTLIRDEIPDEYKWDFSDIYPDWETWSADMVKLERLMDDYAAMQGTIGEDPENLLKAFL
ncbi:MAG: oligoendopeptidase F family protein, partial [candidate division Zixibacteria bacterium]|nr:oligoendopeptidase F family protein [candidate division Zixibacteria bacterium]